MSERDMQERVQKLAEALAVYRSSSDIPKLMNLSAELFAAIICSMIDDWCEKHDEDIIKMAVGIAATIIDVNKPE